MATIFVPELGYDKVSQLVKQAIAQKRPFIDLVVERGMLGEEKVMTTLKSSTKLSSL